MRYAVEGTDARFAIDRAGFLKACYPRITEGQPILRPNAVYDRMFAFYDRNNDGVIRFNEFLSGMAYLRGPSDSRLLLVPYKDTNIDRDGYVNRRDFIRLFRAKNEIQKLLVHNMVEAQEAQYTQEGMERLRSSQPISSIFADEEIPRAMRRARTENDWTRMGTFNRNPE